LQAGRANKVVVVPFDAEMGDAVTHQNTIRDERSQDGVPHHYIAKAIQETLDCFFHLIWFAV
jgi:hypothetical protein